MKNTQSKYPSSIDDRFFFSDCDLNQLPTLEKYEELLRQGMIDEGTALLNNNSVDGTHYPEMDFYGAWVFNLLENRLKAIGGYLSTAAFTKPTLVKFEQLSPHKTSPIGMNWIGNLELEDPANVYVGEDSPSGAAEGDVWINLDGTTTYVDSADRTIYYQETTPTNGTESKVYVPGVGVNTKTSTTLSNEQEWIGN